MCRRFAMATGEGQALSYLVSACLLFFLAQTPAMVRQHIMLAEELPLAGIAAGRLLGMAVFAPIAFYAVAALTVLLLRCISIRISWLSARISLFWSLLAVSPAMLVLGILRGLIDTQSILLPLSIGVAVTFLIFWVVGLLEAVARHGC